MVLAACVGALLLMVHPQDMPDLMDHVANVEVVVATAEVDLRGPAAAKIAPVCPAARGVVNAYRDVRQSGHELLQEVDARTLPPRLHRLPEGLFADVVHIAVPCVPDDDILLPKVCDALQGRIPALRPRQTRAACAGPAWPLPARCRILPLAAARQLQQTAGLRPLVARIPVLFALGGDTVVLHDGVQVADVVCSELQQLLWDAPRLEVAPIAVDADCAGTRLRALQVDVRERKRGGRSLQVPDGAVQPRGATAALGASDEPGQVQALAYAELGAEAWRHGVRVHAVKWQAAAARLRPVPKGAGHVVRWPRTVARGHAAAAAAAYAAAANAAAANVARGPLSAAERLEVHVLCSGRDRRPGAAISGISAGGLLLDAREHGAAACLVRCRLRQALAGPFKGQVFELRTALEAALLVRSLAPLHAVAPGLRHP
mmetsp:Transcript_108350/g.302110  ORF Transcript_108350/g.302110 Transcript_108350/m.302110 type:complete len:431 (-) Transcript_108350:306-1598(-)